MRKAGWISALFSLPPISGVFWWVIEHSSVLSLTLLGYPENKSLWIALKGK